MSYLEIPAEEHAIKAQNITQEFIDKEHPWAYFDGAAQAQGCGGGIILHLTDSHFFHTLTPLILCNTKTMASKKFTRNQAINPYKHRIK